VSKPQAAFDVVQKTTTAAHKRAGALQRAFSSGYPQCFPRDLGI